jgi:hypothetical protein
MRKPAFEPGFDFQRQVLCALDGDNNQISLGCDFGSFGRDVRIIEVFESAPSSFKVQFRMENFLQ